MPTATCVAKSACIGWYARAPSIPTRGGIRRSRVSSSIPRSTIRSTSRSIRPICASTRSAPPAPVATHQQDRFRRSHHALADQHRGPVPERPVAAPQSRRGDGDAEVEALRARASQAARGAAKPRIRRPTSAGGTRSGATCSTSRGSRTCGPTTKWAIRRPFSTATSTISSRRV